MVGIKMVLAGDFLEDAAKADGDTSNDLPKTLTLFRNGNVLERLPIIGGNGRLPPVRNLLAARGVVMLGKGLLGEDYCPIELREGFGKKRIVIVLGFDGKVVNLLSTLTFAVVTLLQSLQDGESGALGLGGLLSRLGRSRLEDLEEEFGRTTRQGLVLSRLVKVDGRDELGELLGITIEVGLRVTM